MQLFSDFSLFPAVSSLRLSGSELDEDAILSLGSFGEVFRFEHLGERASSSSFLVQCCCSGLDVSVVNRSVGFALQSFSLVHGSVDGLWRGGESGSVRASRFNCVGSSVGPM